MRGSGAGVFRGEGRRDWGAGGGREAAAAATAALGLKEQCETLPEMLISVPHFIIPWQGGSCVCVCVSVCVCVCEVCVPVHFCVGV